VESERYIGRDMDPEEGMRVRMAGQYGDKVCRICHKSRLTKDNSNCRRNFSLHSLMHHTHTRVHAYTLDHLTHISQKNKHPKHKFLCSLSLSPSRSYSLSRRVLAPLLRSLVILRRQSSGVFLVWGLRVSANGHILPWHHKHSHIHPFEFSQIWMMEPFCNLLAFVLP